MGTLRGIMVSRLSLQIVVCVFDSKSCPDLACTDWRRVRNAPSVKRSVFELRGLRSWEYRVLFNYHSAKIYSERSGSSCLSPIDGLNSFIWKSLLFDRNTWKNKTVCKLFVFDRNTWNHKTAWKLFVFDRNTWNRNNVSKLFVLDRIPNITFPSWLGL